MIATLLLNSIKVNDKILMNNLYLFLKSSAKFYDEKNMYYIKTTEI